jgi:hypothetical protein
LIELFYFLFYFHHPLGNAHAESHPPANPHKYRVSGLSVGRNGTEKSIRKEAFKSDVSAIPPRRRRLTDCKEKETKSTKPAEDHSAETDQRLTFFDRPTNITDLPKQSAG